MGQTIYIDWEGHEILTEEGYKEKIEEIVEEQYEDDNVLEDWLDDHYSTLELFNMRQHEKENALEDFKDSIYRDVESDPNEYGLYYEEEYID